MRKMLAIFALSLLIFTQTTLASSSDDDWVDLRDLSRLLDAEKRYADKYAASMRGKKKTTTIKPGYEKKCNQDPIDLGLIIDSSVSIDARDYTKGLEFLAGFLEDYNIGPGKNQVRVAAVSFGWGVYTQDGFNFTTYDNKTLVKNHVLTMPFQAGRRTDTGDALKHMREVQMVMRRPWAVQMIVVLTDGNSQRASYTASRAMETKESNITVFAVGVGNVKFQELLNIAGGVKEHVFKAASYDDLDKDVKKELTRKTCFLVPKPTTTTVPSTPAAQPCGLEFPADVNFVFSAATMGLKQTSTVTSFISNVIRHDELNEGFQYGVVSGDCPDDEGFRLNQYQDSEAIREHLGRYDRNNLPDVVQRATETRFTTENGARVNATKTAVIFLGSNKVNGEELAAAIKSMLASDVRVFVSVSDYDILSVVAPHLPSEVTILEGGTFSQATQLVNHLCPNAKKFEEGENLPDYVYDYEGFARS